jgi:hypothetical protein
MSVPITLTYASIFAIFALVLSFRAGGTALITLAVAVYGAWLGIPALLG